MINETIDFMLANYKKLAFFTIGTTGSGKTTWAKERKSINHQVEIIERDMIRAHLHDLMKIEHPEGRPNYHLWDFNSEGTVTQIQDNLFNTAINENKNVIVSDCNLDFDATRKKKIFNDAGYKVIGVVMNVPWSDLLVRKNKDIHDYILALQHKKLENVLDGWRLGSYDGLFFIDK